MFSGGKRLGAPGRDGADQRELKDGFHPLKGLNVCKGAVAYVTAAAGHGFNYIAPLRVLAVSSSGA